MNNNELWNCRFCNGGSPALITSGHCNDWYHYECDECGTKCKKSATQHGAFIYWNLLQENISKQTQDFWNEIEDDKEFWR